MRQDLVGAWRSIWRTPWRSALSICIFALGLTVAGAAFAIVDGVLLKPLPFHNPHELYLVGPPSSIVGGARGSLTPLEVDQVAEAPGVASAAGFINELFDSRYAKREGLAGTKVTPGFFEMLGVRVAIGRSLRPEDQGAVPAPVVISDRFFRLRFASNIDALNRTVRIGNLDLVIVGVMQPGMDYPWHTQVWGLLPRTSEQRFAMRFLTGLVRVADPGRQIEIDGKAAVMQPLVDDVRPPQREAMALLFGATLLLIVVACSHLMAVQLTRLADSTRQTAIRLILGATGRRVARQWMLEGGLLHVAGLALAFPLSHAALAVVMHRLPSDIAAEPAIAVDMRTLAFQSLATLLVVASSGFVVFARFRDNTVSLASLGNAGGDLRGARAGSVLVVSQAVILTAVLYVAVIAARSYDQTRRVDLGFSPTSLYAVSLPLPGGRAPTPLLRDLIAELRADPSIDGVTWGMSPLNRNRTAAPVSVTEPMTMKALRAMPLNADERRIAPDYFSFAGMHIVAGRSFDLHEPVDNVVLSETLAHSIGAAVNAKVYINTNAPSTVIGIASDVRVEGPEAAPRAIVYRLAATPSADLLIRTRTGADVAAAVNPRAQRILGTADPALIVPVKRVYERLMAPQRSRALLLGLLAAMTLLLGAASLGHLVAHAASRSLRETAVRVALGARPQRLAIGMLARTLAKVGLAAMLGSGGGMLAAGVMSSLLFGVNPIDALSVLVTVGVVIAAAAIAVIGPAVRLLRMDPVLLLRAE